MTKGSSCAAFASFSKLHPKSCPNRYACVCMYICIAYAYCCLSKTFSLDGFHTSSICFPFFTTYFPNLRHIWRVGVSRHHYQAAPASFRAHIHLPGCLPCQAAAAVWPSACAPFSDLGRRARSSCCLRRDAAAGSSALQQTPCAPGRHGKNWSWTPLWDEKGVGADKDGQMNEQIGTRNCFSDRLSCSLSNEGATGTEEKTWIDNW